MNESEQSNEIIKPVAKSCEELLAEKNSDSEAVKFPKGEQLNFNVDADVKRITAPFRKNPSVSEESIVAMLKILNPSGQIMIDGKPHMLSRMETDESNSCSAMFEQGEDGKFVIDPDEPILPIQDPFYCGVIEGYHVFGGVSVYSQEKTDDLGYKTVFYRYKNDPLELVGPGGEFAKPFAVGPEHMKDIRLIQLDSGEIGVFTRPQDTEGYGGLGKIGYIRIDSLNHLSECLQKHVDGKEECELIDSLFIDEEWGGANQLLQLEGGRIGVIGHIARFESKPKPDNPDFKIKHYYATSFIFDPKDRSVSDMKIIVEADDFEPKVESEKEDLGDIVFSGGIIRNGDGTATWYGGLGDRRAGRKLIKDPFGDL